MDLENITIALEATLTGHQNPIYTLEQGNDPDILFTAGADKGVVIWDLKTMSFQKLLCKVGSSVYFMKAIPNTDLLAIGTRSGQILIVDVIKQTLVANLKTESGAVFTILINTEKQELIAAGEEGYAYVWYLGDFNLLYRFKISDTTIRVTSISSDSQRLAFGDKNGFIHMFRASDYECLESKKIHSMPVTSLINTGNVFFSGGRDAQLFKLDEHYLEVLQQITPHMFTVYSIDNGGNEDCFATASRDKTFKIWKTADISLLKNVSRDRGYDSHKLSINAMIWRNDRIFTVSDDKTAKVWRLS